MVKTHNRTTAKGRRKVDSDPKNNYFDGYNAARRWAQEKITKSRIGMVLYCVGAGIVIGLLLACLGQ